MGYPHRSLMSALTSSSKRTVFEARFLSPLGIRCSGLDPVMMWVSHTLCRFSPANRMGPRGRSQAAFSRTDVPSSQHNDDRGSVYAKRKEYERAVADYTRAIELDASYGDAYFGRGYAYLWLKKSELARADFAQHATLTPDSVRAAWMVIYANFSRQRPGPEIVESLEKTIAINPQSRYAKICQGVALGLQGNYSDGLAVLEQSMQTEEPPPDAFFWKGMFHTYVGQDGTATEAVLRALQLGLPPLLLTPPFLVGTRAAGVLLYLC
jgi:tetratricopeptide (TPR) repeat protein